MLDLELGQQPGLSGSPGGPIFSPQPAAVLVCIYRSQSSELARSGTISGSAETTVLQGLESSASTARCSAKPAQFAVIQSETKIPQVAWVELGGCDRVLRPDNTVGYASAAALKIIAGV